MDTTTQINYLKRAYKYGQQDAKKSGFTGWYTPRLKMAYDLGYEGITVDFTKIVSGYRYGAAPEYCSINYIDNTMEWGVGMASVENTPEIGASVWFCDRKKIYLSGVLIDATGSDGAPLIIPLDMDKQFDF